MKTLITRFAAAAFLLAAFLITSILAVGEMAFFAKPERTVK